jgi:hypothetical protein
MKNSMKNGKIFVKAAPRAAGMLAMALTFALILAGCSMETLTGKVVLEETPGFPADTLLADFGVPGMASLFDAKDSKHQIRSAVVDVLEIAFTVSRADDNAVKAWFASNGWKPHILGGLYSISASLNGEYMFMVTKEGCNVNYTRNKSTNSCLIQVTRKK